MSVVGSPTYNRDSSKALRQSTEKKDQSSAGSIEVPAGSFVEKIIVHNKTANAVLGGISFGTTEGGADIITALTVGASAFVAENPLKTVFNRTKSQVIYFNAITAWNGASVDITIIYGVLS